MKEVDYEEISFLDNLSKTEIINFLLIQYGKSLEGMKGKFSLLDKETYTREEVEKITSYHYHLGKWSIVNDLNYKGFQKRNEK